MIGLGIEPLLDEQRCLNPKCKKLLKGAKKEKDGYCCLYCKNQVRWVKEEEALAIEAAIEAAAAKKKPRCATAWTWKYSSQN